jgi:Flp pilus assembly protein TadD
MSASSFQLQAAERLYREGRLDEALAAFEACLAVDPRLAPARSFRGVILCSRGDFDGGLADLREAVAIAPRDPAWHANLGMILFVVDRLDEAEASLRRALTIQPNHPEAAANLSLALRARGDFGGAERAARAALATRPDLAEARVNLGYALLAQGKFAEGWAAAGYRPHALVNLRDPAMRVTVPHHDALPPQPGAIIVHAEQGLGDTLFFLRFVPQLRALGHRLAFWGDARLHSILKRTGHFEHFMGAEAMPGPGLTLLWAGDLPRLLGAVDPTSFPPPLPLAADPQRRAAWGARLAAWGPAPYLGITWRAGLPRAGRVVLSKGIPPEMLGGAVAGLGATLVSLQRKPEAREAAALAASAGVALHDASSANEDLEDALALLDLLDDYVCVSNTNTHLRASLGRRAHVLVPWPPEWRWLESGRSPWFASIPTYRQGRDGDWGAAVAQLRTGLGARA